MSDRTSTWLWAPIRFLLGLPVYAAAFVVLMVPDLPLWRWAVAGVLLGVTFCIWPDGREKKSKDDDETIGFLRDMVAAQRETIKRLLAATDEIRTLPPQARQYCRGCSLLALSRRDEAKRGCEEGGEK